MGSVLLYICFWIYSLFTILLGYEDARRKSFEGLNLVESSRFNKSLYALLNVIYAINANETRVPYRESKLTRMLQNSFGGTNHVLMLTCLVRLSICEYMNFLIGECVSITVVFILFLFLNCRTHCFVKTVSAQQV